MCARAESIFAHNVFPAAHKVVSLSPSQRHYIRMCNLYSFTRSQQAIIEATRVMSDHSGNLPLLPGIFPDYAAPIVRTGADGARELVKARWGMPSPAFTLQGEKVEKGVTNVRNTASPNWRRWLGPASRCVAPSTSFSKPTQLPDGRSVPVWFALDESRPLAFFAGICTRLTCTERSLRAR